MATLLLNRAAAVDFTARVSTWQSVPHLRRISDGFHRQYGLLKVIEKSGLLPYLACLLLLCRDACFLGGKGNEHWECMAVGWITDNKLLHREYTCKRLQFPQPGRHALARVSYSRSVRNYPVVWVWEGPLMVHSWPCPRSYWQLAVTRRRSAVFPLRFVAMKDYLCSSG